MEVTIEDTGYSFLYEGKKHFIEYGNLVANRVNGREKEYQELENRQRWINDRISTINFERNIYNEQLSYPRIKELLPDEIEGFRWADNDIKIEIEELNKEYQDHIIYLGLINIEINSMKKALVSTNDRAKLSRTINKFFSSDTSQTLSTRFFVKGNKVQYAFVLDDEYDGKTIDINKTLNPLFLYDLYMVIQNDIGFALCTECSSLIRYKRNTVKYCDNCRHKGNQKKQKKIQPHNTLCNKLRRRSKSPDDNYELMLRAYQEAYLSYSRNCTYDELLYFIDAVNKKTTSAQYDDVEDFKIFLKNIDIKKEDE